MDPRSILNLMPLSTLKWEFLEKTWLNNIFGFEGDAPLTVGDINVDLVLQLLAFMLTMLVLYIICSSRP